MPEKVAQLVGEDDSENEGKGVTEMLAQGVGLSDGVAVLLSSGERLYSSGEELVVIEGLKETEEEGVGDEVKSITEEEVGETVSKGRGDEWDVSVKRGENEVKQDLEAELSGVGVGGVNVSVGMEVRLPMEEGVPPRP